MSEQEVHWTHWITSFRKLETLDGLYKASFENLVRSLFIKALRKDFWVIFPNAKDRKPKFGLPWPQVAWVKIIKSKFRNANSLLRMWLTFLTYPVFSNIYWIRCVIYLILTTLVVCARKLMKFCFRSSLTCQCDVTFYMIVIYAGLKMSAYRPNIPRLFYGYIWFFLKNLPKARKEYLLHKLYVLWIFLVNQLVENIKLAWSKVKKPELKYSY